MDREIKFRAWDETSGYERWDSLTCPSYSMPEVFCQGRILEQYTGLKDKNGKEIYEGDILKWENGYKHMDFYTEVEFWNGSFLAVGKQGQAHKIKPMDDGGGSLYYFTVAGNIHDHPEVL